LYHQLKSRLPELFPESGSALKRRTKVFFDFIRRNLFVQKEKPWHSGGITANANYANMRFFRLNFS